MTVIAGFAVEGLPILMGDLLVSGPESPGRSVNIPSIGDARIVFPEGSGFIPTGVRQKVNLISNNLVIAWANNRLAAQTIIKDLLEEDRKKSFTYDRLQGYFESLRGHRNN